jgi:hypothetical protein
VLDVSCGHRPAGGIEFVDSHHSAQESKLDAGRLLFGYSRGLADALAKVVPQIAVSPADAWNVVLDPRSEIDASRARLELTEHSIPKTADIFVLFARLDMTAALIALVLLASLPDDGAIESGGFVIAEAVHHSPLVGDRDERADCSVSD